MRRSLFVRRGEAGRKSHIIRLLDSFGLFLAAFAILAGLCVLAHVFTRDQPVSELCGATRPMRSPFAFLVPPVDVNPPFSANHRGDAEALVAAANYTVTFLGVYFFLPFYPQDLIQRELVERGNFYESKDLGLIARCVPEGSVVFDIGSNIGNHAVYWGTQNKASRIYAFEPVPSTFEIMSRNVVITPSMRSLFRSIWR
jgi:hypothetical protein